MLSDSDFKHGIVPRLDVINISNDLITLWIEWFQITLLKMIDLGFSI